MSSLVTKNHEGRRIGESHHNARHPDTTVRAAREMRRRGIGYKRIAKALGTHPMTVRDWVTFATRWSA